MRLVNRGQAWGIAGTVSVGLGDEIRFDLAGGAPGGINQGVELFPGRAARGRERFLMHLFRAPGRTRAVGIGFGHAWRRLQSPRHRPGPPELSAGPRSRTAPAGGRQTAWKRDPHRCVACRCAISSMCSRTRQGGGCCRRRRSRRLASRLWAAMPSRTALGRASQLRERVGHGNKLRHDSFRASWPRLLRRSACAET